MNGLELLNIDSWMDVADHLVVIVGAIILAAVPTWAAARNHRAIKSVGAKTDTIRDQVVNGHTETNLRNDVDRVIAAVDDLTRDVRALRDELLDEKADRRAQIGDLRDELDHRTGKRRRAL